MLLDEIWGFRVRWGGVIGCEVGGLDGGGVFLYKLDWGDNFVNFVLIEELCG